MIIRKISFDDLMIRVEWMNNPKIYRSMHYDIPVKIENTQLWYEKIKLNPLREDFVFIENESIVAMGGLVDVDVDVNKAELYIFVNPNNQKSGVGTKATKLLCDWGFCNMSLNKIYLYTNEDNIPAQIVYKKCGFVLEGRLRQEYKTPEGIYKDRLYYGLLKDDY